MAGIHLGVAGCQAALVAGLLRWFPERVRLPCQAQLGFQGAGDWLLGNLGEG